MLRAAAALLTALLPAFALAQSKLPLEVYRKFKPPFFSMDDCITGQRSDHLCAVSCQNSPLARVYRSLRRPVEADFDAL